MLIHGAKVNGIYSTFHISARRRRRKKVWLWNKRVATDIILKDLPLILFIGNVELNECRIQKNWNLSIQNVENVELNEYGFQKLKLQNVELNECRIKRERTVVSPPCCEIDGEMQTLCRQI